MHHGSYAIRRAEPQDAAGIVAVARSTWQATYEGIIPREVQELALSEWYAPERIAQQTLSHRNAFFVALDGEGRVVAFAHITRRPEPGDAELARFYTLPEHQGRGIGRALLRAAVAALESESPVKRLFAQVERENRIGRKAYERLGFTVVREYEDELFGHVSPMVELCLDPARL